MDKTYSRINWENEPSIYTPLNAMNLNKIDNAVNVIDNRVIELDNQKATRAELTTEVNRIDAEVLDLDTTKAEQSDLLQTVKSVTFNDTTGVFTFTFHNGTVVTADLNIEKIPVSFSMDELGVITMTNADGTKYTADVGELIKTYSFADSSDIDFTVVLDDKGNKTVTAIIKDGSITDEKLANDYLASIKVESKKASDEAIKSAQSAVNSADMAVLAESYAKGGTGTRTGEDTDNAKYYAEQARSVSYQQSDWNEENPTQSAFINNKPFNTLSEDFEVEDGMLHVVGGKGGLLPLLHIISETGSTVTVVKDDITLTPIERSGVWEIGVPEYGTWTIHSVNELGDATATVYVDTVKIYNIDDSHFNATISVEYPVNATCSCSKGEEIYYATSSPFLFSVHSTGIWTISATRDGVTVTKSVNITMDGQSTSVKLEMATITLTLDEEFFGQTITGTNGTDVKTWVADSSEKTFTVSLGTWKFSCEVDGTLYETAEVNVEAYEEYTAELSFIRYGYKGWLESVGIADTFGSLESLLADQATIRILMNKHASVDYLTEWIANDEARGRIILDNDYCAKWINLKDYALDTLYSNSTVKAIMDEVDKYGYGEWVKKNISLVPTMTSDNTPSGEAFASASYNGYYAWKVFDNTNIDYFDAWSSAGSPINAYIGYKFTIPTCVKGVKLTNRNSSNASYITPPKEYKIQASNDGNNWIDLTDVLTNTNVASNTTYADIKLNNNELYLYYRVLVISGTSTSFVTFGQIDFYTEEWQPKGNVPIMTSNNAPYGEVFVSSVYNSQNGYLAFDGDTESKWIPNTTTSANEHIGYKFTNPISVRKVKTYNDTETIFGAKLQYSDDGVTYHDTDLSAEIRGSVENEYNVSDYGYHLYWKMQGVSGGRQRYNSLQFYGRELKVSVPTMTSNTEPWGVASGNPSITCFVNGGDKGGSAYWGFFQKAYKDSSGVRSFVDIALNGYIQYEFPKAEIITHFTSINNHDGEIYWVDRIEIKASNDDSEYITLKTFNRERGAWRRTTVSFNEELKAYKYFRIYNRDTRNSISIGTSADFFGLDYSEHEERHYIYDHGVEVEEITQVPTSYSGYKNEKRSDCLYLYKSSSSSENVQMYVTNRIDFANNNYKLARFVTDRYLQLDGNSNSFGSLWTTTKAPCSDGETGTHLKAYRLCTPNDVPKNYYCDVQNIKDSQYLTYQISLSATRSAEISIKEWWLE